MTQRQIDKRYMNRIVAHRHTPKSSEVYYRVTDAAPQWGHWRLFVAPVAGEGTEWLDAKKCRVLPDGGPNASKTNEPVGSLQQPA